MMQRLVNILVVEDEEDIAVALAGSLRTLDGVGQVTTTASAEWALAEMARRAYGLVLCDVRLKGMDGLELLSRIRQSHPHTRVLLMTAFPSDHIQLHALRLGSDGLVEKPFDLGQLRHEVSRLLRAARRELAKEPPPGTGTPVAAGTSDEPAVMRK
ncbi:MAG: response regulator [bacterium]|jgi:DNA-binding response OmpR family regulator|nr:response regulator [candidate division KSB1 bacterium]MDH7561462.1 response regulator [bacterium]